MSCRKCRRYSNLKVSCNFTGDYAELDFISRRRSKCSSKINNSELITSLKDIARELGQLLNKTSSINKTARNSFISDAIKKRKVISFHYNGGERIVEPHCYGSSHAGVELLRAYQTSGYSRSGIHVGWKLFRVYDIRDLRVRPEGFKGYRPKYNPRDSMMRSFYARI